MHEETTGFNNCPSKALNSLLTLSFIYYITPSETATYIQNLPAHVCQEMSKF